MSLVIEDELNNDWKVFGNKRKIFKTSLNLQNNYQDVFDHIDHWHGLICYPDEYSREPMSFEPSTGDEQPIEPIADIGIDRINDLMFNHVNWQIHILIADLFLFLFFLSIISYENEYRKECFEDASINQKSNTTRSRTKIKPFTTYCSLFG